MERLKSFRIQSLSINDVLDCFPNRNDTNNEHRHAFYLWTKSNDDQWWSNLFEHISKNMTQELWSVMCEKPIFILQDTDERQYLPINDKHELLLFIAEHSSRKIWKRQLTVLRHRSVSEQTALVRSSHVQSMTDERMIEIILQDHLQLSLSSMMNLPSVTLIDELWQDLHFLQSHQDELEQTVVLLVPIGQSSSLALIQNVVLPTVLGIDIRTLMNSTELSTIAYPYYTGHNDALINHLQWEYFFLKMNCQQVSICLPQTLSTSQLPLLPSFSSFVDVNSARLAEFILSAQSLTTQNSLRQFPMLAYTDNEQQIVPVSAIFDETIVIDQSSLPCISLPTYCRSLATRLNVCIDYDLRACVTSLQCLANQKSTDIDHYIQWLGRLQLYVRQQYDAINRQDLLSSCQLYLPETNEFCSLEKLVIISTDDKQHRPSIDLVCQHLELKFISPTNNQIYWQFKDLFRRLGCRCAISISDICSTIQHARSNTNNYFDLGDGRTNLSERGVETMIQLCQYLEHQIKTSVIDHLPHGDLYQNVIENRPAQAVYGTREDLQWRFKLTSTHLSQQFTSLTSISCVRQHLPLMTFNRTLISTRSNHFIYACLESKLIQSLSHSSVERYFISPIITHTCPLLLAVCNIDYVERHGVIQWVSNNNSLENHLSQLTTIFRKTLDDPSLEVLIGKYATIRLFFSDAHPVESLDDFDSSQIRDYRMEHDYPFWVFNTTILLCAGKARDDGTRALIAASALANLLHKWKHVPFDEANSIAQKKISQCNEFRSQRLSPLAGTDARFYLFTDLVFPVDDQAVDVKTISISSDCTIEQDPEDERGAGIAVHLISEHRMYQSQAQNQLKINHRKSPSNHWQDSIIVDTREQLRIGQNAEHFFFVYLQQLYGTSNVTPTQNWCSSSRLIVYPQQSRCINDAIGYDFNLEDIRQKFVTPSGARTARCYFEVKGTSGLFHPQHTQFYISENELNTCKKIAYDTRRKEYEAYFIVIVERCLNPETIALAEIINWYVRMSWSCRIYLFSSGAMISIKLKPCQIVIDVE
jgi:hypothetical protein